MSHSVSATSKPHAKAGTSSSSVRRKRSASEAVLAHAFDTFGSRQKTDHWLHRPNHIFQGRTPLEMIESDPQAVEIELTKIDHGVYI